MDNGRFGITAILFCMAGFVLVVLQPCRQSHETFDSRLPEALHLAGWPCFASAAPYIRQHESFIEAKLQGDL